VVLFSENDREGFEPEVEDSWKHQSENQSHSVSIYCAKKLRR
jgi:hypothetical protein